MPKITFNGDPGDTWRNDTGKVQFQLVVNWSNSCGLCCQFDHAVGPSWPIPFHRGCLLPGTEIIAPGVVAGFEARYSGPVYRITFDDGVSVSITANHMLLTPTGFAMASSLVEGEDVIYSPLAEREAIVNPDDDRKPALIEEVIKSLSVGRGVVSPSMPVTTEDLHGDGRRCKGDIHVVTADGFLHHEVEWGVSVAVNDALHEHHAKGIFQIARLRTIPLAAQRDLAALLLAMRDATDGGVGSLRERKAALRAELRHSERQGLTLIADLHQRSFEDLADCLAGRPEVCGHRVLAHATEVHGQGETFIDGRRAESEALGFTHAAEWYAKFREPMADDGCRDAERLRQVFRRFPGEVATRKVACINVMHYSGSVFDVQTTSSLYVFRNGVASSNCRCKQILVRPGAESQPFVDFREKIADLDPLQQSRVVGRSNLTLVEKGVVKWSDVVTPNRVRDFREVVARQKLSVQGMTRAGVSPRLARDAHAAVHTPAHQLAEARRQELLGKLAAKGVERGDIRRALAERLAARVGVGAGPSGAGALPVTPSTPKPPVLPPVARPTLRPTPLPRKIARPRPKPQPVPAIGAGATPQAVQTAYLTSLGVKPSAIARVQAGAAPGATTPPLTPVAPKAFSPPPPASAKPFTPPARPKPPKPPAPAAAPAPQPAPQPPASMLDAAVLWAAKHGVKVVPNGHAILKVGRAPGAVPIATYAFMERVIYLNERDPYWTDPAAVMTDAAAARWLSSDAHDHIIVHEVGHAMHHRATGDTYKFLRTQPFTPEQAALVRREVSNYAATRPVEFVAETYAGLSAGKSYSIEIMRLYRQFGGPRP